MAVELNMEDKQCRVYSVEYDDIYFNAKNGRAESDYVFFAPNQVREKLVEVKNGGRDSLVITELGFGTGLNFFELLAKIIRTEELIEMTEARKVKETNTTACDEKVKHIIEYRSVEKYPLNIEEMRTILKTLQFDEIPQDTVNAFFTYWDNFIKTECEGWNKLSLRLGVFEVVLKLYVGDISVFLRDLSKVRHEDFTDVWFLDGFAPSKNSEMWSSLVFETMKETSKKGASYATFTAAGAVKRGLMNAGFSANKVKGYGRKREMLTGFFSG